jgi:(1->4)-alpha-D-glucan 1-alpha-D-glucosylmutase
MEKATKEAKRRTSWINPDAGYDQALRDFVTRLLAPRSPFRDAFLPFQRLVALYGSVNSLAQTLLKIASPGIPDFYQGSELWDLSLVDPDNRRPVDFAARQRLLDELQQRAAGGPESLQALCTELMNSWRDGRVKMYVTHRGLTLRKDYPALFRAGSYDPLPAGGERAEHVIALARRADADAVVVVVPRLSARLTGFSGQLPIGQAIWGDTWVSLDRPGLEGVYTDRFTGQRLTTELRDGIPVLPLSSLLGFFPVALLKREENP